MICENLCTLKHTVTVKCMPVYKGTINIVGTQITVVWMTLLLSRHIFNSYKGFSNLTTEFLTHTILQMLMSVPLTMEDVNMTVPIQWEVSCAGVLVGLLFNKMD